MSIATKTVCILVLNLHFLSVSAAQVDATVALLQHIFERVLQKYVLQSESWLNKRYFEISSSKTTCHFYTSSPFQTGIFKICHHCPFWISICKLCKTVRATSCLSLRALLQTWSWPPRRRVLISLNNSHTCMDLIPWPNSAPLMVSLSLMGHCMKAQFAFLSQHLSFFDSLLFCIGPTHHLITNLLLPADHKRSLPLFLPFCPCLLINPLNYIKCILNLCWLWTNVLTLLLY